MEQPLFFILKLADVIAILAGWKSHICTEFGRCYCQVADVIAPVFYVMADVIAKRQMEFPLRAGDVLGRCYNQVGRWNCHRVCLFFMLILVLRCYIKPHPIYVADGICQCFYPWMDY